MIVRSHLAKFKTVIHSLPVTALPPSSKSTDAESFTTAASRSEYGFDSDSDDDNLSDSNKSSSSVAIAVGGLIDKIVMPGLLKSHGIVDAGGVETPTTLHPSSSSSISVDIPSERLPKERELGRIFAHPLASRSQKLTIWLPKLQGRVSALVALKKEIEKVAVVHNEQDLVVENGRAYRLRAIVGGAVVDRKGRLIVEGFHVPPECRLDEC